MMNFAISKSRIKFTHLLDQIDPSLGDFRWQSFAPDIFVSGSHFHHDLALRTFNNQIGKDQRTKIIQDSTLGAPIKDGSKVSFFGCPSITRFALSAKVIFKPFDDDFVAATDNNAGMELPSVSVSTLTHLPYIETTFPINQSGQIGNLSNGVGFNEISSSSHKTSFCKYYSILNEDELNVQSERLNSLAA